MKNKRTAEVHGTTVFAYRPPNPMYGETGTRVQLTYWYGTHREAVKAAREWRQNRHECVGKGRCVDCLRKDALLTCGVCGHPKAVGHKLDIRLLRRMLRSLSYKCERTWDLTNVAAVLLKEIDALKGRVAKLEKRP